jgi:ribosomal protein S18 acetylase RimI-like enzyme
MPRREKRGVRAWQPLSDTSSPAMLGAVEASHALFYADLGRVAGGELYEAPGLVWFISGVRDAAFNGVVRTQLDAAEETITETLAHFARRGMPLSWHTTPASRPADLGARLETHGLTRGRDVPHMVIDIEAMRDDPTPPGLTIQPVEDDAALRAWCAVFYAEAPALLPACLALYGGLGLDPRGPLRHFLGLLDGEPVATASRYLGAGIAGVQHVTTLAAARRRGIGTALTRAALREAAGRGYRVGQLGSSAMAVRLYERLGFRTVCTFGLYTATG